LLFDPHQPKSGVPADVTSDIGPPSQQGAPPRISYNLEDNVTGGNHGGLEALLGPSHGPGALQHPADVNPPPNNNPPPNVVGSPYGVPNFRFGPDTWVFGPQTVRPSEARTARRPIRPTDSEISPDLESSEPQNSAPTGEAPSDSAPDDDHGASLPHEQPISQSANPRNAQHGRLAHDSALMGATSAPPEVSGLGDFDDKSAGLDALEDDPSSSLALEAKAVDRLIAADRSLGEIDAARWRPWPAAPAIDQPDSDRSDVFIPAVLATGLLAPAAGRDRSGRARDSSDDHRGWLRPVRRLRR
jgi:hypothetical protein